MAKQATTVLKDNTPIDFIAINGEYVHIKRTTYYEAKNTPRIKGWTYRFYQIGTHAFKENRKP